MTTLITKQTQPDVLSKANTVVCVHDLDVSNFDLA
jgi:hypothetical protein